MARVNILVTEERLGLTELVIFIATMRSAICAHQPIG